MASSLNNAPWMEWIETLMRAGSRQRFASTLPPDRYYCVLDELPMHLIPRPSLERLEPPSSGPLILNPDCELLSGDQLPRELAEHPDLASGFALQGTLAWVPDGVGNRLPFWLGPGVEEAIRSLGGNPVDVSMVASEYLVLLHAAGILVNQEREAVRVARRHAGLRRGAALFRDKGYAPLRELIHPFHVAALRRYYRQLIRTGAVPLGDRQSARRYAAYNDPVARFFHHQIAKPVSILSGETLRPTYLYLASYLGGSELKKHTDREQCEFSVTLCLDFSPEPARETPWPICLDTPSGIVTVYQALGDGLAYRGTRLPHYRDVLGEEQTSTSIFFHYVDENFTGPLE